MAKTKASAPSVARGQSDDSFGAQLTVANRHNAIEAAWDQVASIFIQEFKRECQKAAHKCELYASFTKSICIGASTE